MKKTALFFTGFFLSFSLAAQTLSNQLLGYQEPYTKIEAQTTDSIGNVYYGGTFKGALVINNQTVFTGNGGDDVFVAKINREGQLLWAKKYGDAGNEMFSSLAYHKGALYMSMMILQSSQIEGVTYSSYPVGNSTSLVAKLDTVGGTIQWVKKNSLPNTRVLPSSDILYVQGAVNFPSQNSTVLFESTQLEGPGSTNRMFFLYLDTSGNFHGHKLLTTSQSGSTAIMLSAMPAVNNRMIFLLNYPSTQSIQLGSKTINLATRSNYQLLVKTDSSFTDLQYKILNPNAETYGYNLYIENAGFTVSPHADSIYMILNSAATTAGSYKLDGFDVPVADQNVLLVMDTNFVTAKVKPLSVHRRGTVFFKIAISHVVADSGYYYFRGRLTGANNSVPVKGTVAQREEVELLYGLKDTFDFEGASRSFIVKARKDLSEARVSYLGYHVPYESPTLPASFVSQKNNKLFFLHLADNIWNPWVIDSSLAILNGGMKSNADRGETTSYVKYYSDGTKIVVGQARGKTALDEDSIHIISNQLKTDLFLVGYNQNSQVNWYRRVTHSFATISAQKIVTRGDLTYISFYLNGPRNNGNNNYIRIDSSVYFITPAPPQNAGILVVDKNGNVKLLQLPTPFNSAIVFDVFTDGTMAVASTPTTTNLTVPGKIFNTSNGLYVANIDTALVIKDAIKFMPSANTSFSMIADLMIDTVTQSMKVLLIGNIGPSAAGNSFTVNNGINGNVSYSVVNPLPASPAAKMYMLALNSNFKFVNNLATIGPMNSYARSSAHIADRLYFLFGKTTKDSVFYNNTMIIADSNTNVRYMLSVDTSLNYKKHRTLFSSSENRIDFTFISLAARNNKLYASGTNWAPFVYDTINVGHTGITDAITIQMDTAMKGKQLFRLASPYIDNMFGCDVFADSLISFAYTTQGSPVFTTGRVRARTTTIDANDLDENAYIQTVLLKTGVITSVDEEQVVEGFKVFPNPVRSKMVIVDLGKTVAGNYQWLLYNTEGRLIESNMLNWNPGQSKQIQFTNQLQTGHYVFVVKTKEAKTIKAVKLTIIQGQ